MTPKPCIKAVCIVVIGCLLFSIPASGWAQSIGKVKVKAPPKEDKIPADLAPEQVDSYLAGLTDQQARRLFAAELKNKAAAKSNNGTKEQVVGKETGLVFGFFAAERALSTLSDQLGWVLAGAGTSAETEVWENLVGGAGLGHFLMAMAWLVLIIGLGWGAEKLLLYKTEKFRSQLLQEIPRGGWEKAGIILSRLILDGLGIGVYVLVTFLAHFMITGQGQNAYLVSSAIIMTYYFRLIEITARLIASPKTPELRLVPMTDTDARFLYNYIVWITAAVVPGSALALALQKAGASRELFLFVYATAGPVISILLAVMIWQIRQRVARVICPLGDPGSIPGWLLRQRCADLWHYPAILFALTIGVYWWARVLTRGDVTIISLIFSLFLVPLCIGMDQWLQQILSRLGGKPQEVIDFTAPDEPGETEPEKPAHESSDPSSQNSGKDLSLYFPLIRNTFRVGLLGFLFFAALDLWGIDLDVGWIFARSVLGVIIALLLGLIVWELAKVRIDKKIREEAPFQSDEAEEGGSGGSRIAHKSTCCGFF